MSAPALKEFAFYIRYTRTGVRVLKEMSGVSYEDALKDLQAIQREFAGGKAAFEIESLPPPPPDLPREYAGEEHKEIVMKDDNSGFAAFIVAVSVVVCIVYLLVS